MIPATILGMALAVGALLTMVLLEGSSPLALILLAPLILVFGGTFGAAIAGSMAADLRRIGSWFGLAFARERESRNGALIALLVDLAAKARREGMLPLENQARKIEDPFLREGLQLAIDGVPAEQLRDVLDGQIAGRRSEHRTAALFFERMGGYAPTIGIVGTIVGLIHVLKQLDDAAALGPLVSAAFVATLWGVMSANFVWLPISNKIRRNSDLQIAELELIVEGVCEIMAGTSPRDLRQRLTSMLPPSEAAELAAA